MVTVAIISITNVVFIHLQCKDMVDIYGSKIMDLIVNDFDASKICKEINMCTSEAPHLHTSHELVGSEKCTFGPSHWCKNEKNAKRCGNGALKFCQQKVWLNTKPNN